MLLHGMIFIIKQVSMEDLNGKKRAQSFRVLPLINEMFLFFSFGYPDPTYLYRIRQELADKGYK